MKNMSYPESIVTDFVQITGDLFNHELAWQEAEYSSIIANASSLMTSAERLGFFMTSVAELTSQNVSKVIRDSRDEVTMFLDHLLPEYVSNFGLERLPVPPYINLDRSDWQEGEESIAKWHSLGVTYDIAFLTNALFPAQNNVIAGIGSSTANTVFNSEDNIMGFSFNNGTSLPSGVLVKIQFDTENQASMYVSNFPSVD